MRRPRIQFTVRRLMLAIAVCALTLGIAPVAFRSGYKLWWTWIVVQDIKSSGQSRASAEGYEMAGPRALEALREAVRSGPKKTRLHAMQELGRIGQDPTPAFRELARPAVPDLIAALTDDDEEIRIWAAITLGQTGPNGANAVEPLVAAALLSYDDHPQLVVCAIKALGEIGPAARPALPVLAPMVNERDNRTHIIAVHAFWRIGPKGPAEASLVVPRLLDRLTASKNSRERAWIAEILSEMGPSAREAIPALSTAADDPDTQVASAARKALKAVTATRQSAGGSVEMDSRGQ
jgi:HEAT repeat protein